MDEMVISPSERQSGVTILQPSFQNIAIMNEYRRRAIAYVTREWYVPEGGGARVPFSLDGAAEPVRAFRACTEAPLALVPGAGTQAG